MTPHNPSLHLRTAADALDRLVREVQTGRAEWTHPRLVRQAVEDAARLSAAAATVLQYLAAAHGQVTPPGPQTAQTVAALHQAGQHTATAATHLRQARRTLH
jgi:hypothetical protein